MSWFYYVTRVLVIVLFALLTRCRVRGRENVPEQGAVLIVANHLNLADPPLLGVCLKRKVIFMAKEGLFRSRFSSYFIRCLGAFPVHRGRLDRKALRQAGQVLADGQALVMFPEGSRSRDARLWPALPGSALIALRSGTPVLPIGITGTEKIKGLTWLVRRPRLMVNIGRPFYPPSAGSKSTKDELIKFTTLVMGRIAELLPEEYRGSYTGKEASRHEN